MKRHTHILQLAVALFMLISFTANAQTVYTYDLDELGGVGTVASGVSATSLSRVNGLADFAACPDGFNSNNWSLAGDFNIAGPAVQLTLTPDPGASMTLTSIVTDLHRNNNGPQKMRVAYSLTGGASWITGVEFSDVPTGSCFTSTTYTWNFADITTSNAVIFRFYGWDASNVNGLGTVRHTVINGTATPCVESDWYADTDMDGFGDAGSVVSACTAPVGYVADNTDCNDGEATAYPGATEICDGIDNDCDAEIDEDLVSASISPEVSAITCKSFPIEFSTETCVDCTYQWFKNDNPLPGATDPTYSTTKPAYYSVQVNTPGGCFAVSEHTLLITGFNPNANIYYPNGLNLCAPTPGNNILVKVGYLATNTYQWYQDGLPYEGSGADSWKIYPTEPGTYTCSITSIDGCNRVTDEAVVINSCRLANSTASALAIYPNPASSNFTIDMTIAENVATAQIQVVNMVGQVVANYDAIVDGGFLNYTINATNLNSGMYMIRVITGANEYSTQVLLNK